MKKAERAAMSGAGNRNSNVELLRIICIFMIITGHFAGQCGDVAYRACAGHFLVALLTSGHRVAVNIFLLIGVWYMVDATFKASRILKLYGQVFIFSVPITVVMLLLNGTQVSAKDMMRGFLPFFGRGLWYASAYITLLFFSPFLKKALDMQKERLRLLVVLMLILFSCVCTLPDIQESYVCDCVWFLIVYLIVGYVKRYPLKLKYGNWVNLLAGGGYLCSLGNSQICGKAWPVWPYVERWRRGFDISVSE